jgi:TRAP-type C4-dicarboxylate transport system substrate-binding protein
MSMGSAKGTKPAYDFLKRVEKDCKGKIEIKLFEPGEHPYTPTDVLKAVRKNTFQIAFTMSSYAQGLFKEMGLPDLPNLVEGKDEFLAMIENPEYKDVLDYSLINPLKSYNQFPIGWYAPGGYMFAGPRFVDDLESWKGLRIRIYSDLMAKMMKIYGASPVNVSWDEVYTSLARNMIDGFLTALMPAYAAKLYEPNTTKWVTLNEFQVGLHFLTINQETFDKFPKELQETFSMACKENTKWMQAEFKRLLDESYTAAMNEYGVRLKAIDPKLKEEVRNRMKPLYEDWAKSVGGDAQKMLERVEAHHKAYISK